MPDPGEMSLAMFVIAASIWGIVQVVKLLRNGKNEKATAGNSTGYVTKVACEERHVSASEARKTLNDKIDSDRGHIHELQKEFGKLQIANAHKLGNIESDSKTTRQMVAELQREQKKMHGELRETIGKLSKE